MKVKILLAGMMILGSLTLGAETIITRETVEGKTSQTATVITRTPEGGLIRESSESTEGSSVNLVAPDHSLRELTFTMKEGRGTLRSNGKTLTYDVKFDGKEFRGTTDLKGLPWFGNFERGLRHMMQYKKDRLVFASISLADPGKVTEMEFIREGTEKIGAQEAAKVKVTLTGLMSAFWSAQFWVNAEGRVLRYQGNFGPGTPDRLIELVRVEN